MRTLRLALLVALLATFWLCQLSECKSVGSSEQHHVEKRSARERAKQRLNQNFLRFLSAMGRRGPEQLRRDAVQLQQLLQGSSSVADYDAVLQGLQDLQRQRSKAARTLGFLQLLRRGRANHRQSRLFLDAIEDMLDFFDGLDLDFLEDLVDASPDLLEGLSDILRGVGDILGRGSESDKDDD